MTKVIATDMISKTTITIPDDNLEKIDRYIEELKNNNHKLRKLSVVRNGEEEILINKEEE